MHLAAIDGDPAVPRTFTKIVGDVNTKNVAGDTALHIVAAHSVPVLISPPQMWRQTEPQPKPSFNAGGFRRKLAAVEAMIEAGARTDIADALGLTPDQRIGDQRGQERIVELLSPRGWLKRCHDPLEMCMKISFATIPPIGDRSSLDCL